MRFSALFVGVAAFFVVAGPILGASQRDWDDCNADDPGRSLGGCTRILSGRGETAKNRFLAYFNRGYAYEARGNLGRAIADYNKAIRLDPKAAVAHYDRGVAYHVKGDVDRAIADYNKAIQLDPMNAHAYRIRGLAYLYSGSLAKASADFSQASEVDPKNAYNALWSDIVAQRNNVASRLPQAISKIDMTEWPAPVILMLLGQIMPAAVLVAADDSDANKRQGQVCEANFYGGELALREGAKNETVRLFRLAASGCPQDSEEWVAANAELKALGVGR